jgi:hypothetical protein
MLILFVAGVLTSCCLVHCRYNTVLCLVSPCLSYNRTQYTQRAALIAHIIPPIFFFIIPLHFLKNKCSGSIGNEVIGSDEAMTLLLAWSDSRRKHPRRTAGNTSSHSTEALSCSSFHRLSNPVELENNGHQDKALDKPDHSCTEWLILPFLHLPGSS